MIDLRSKFQKSEVFLFNGFMVFGFMMALSFKMFGLYLVGFFLYVIGLLISRAVVKYVEKNPGYHLIILEEDKLKGYKIGFRDFDTIDIKKDIFGLRKQEWKLMLNNGSVIDFSTDQIPFEKKKIFFDMLAECEVANVVAGDTR